MTCHLGDFTEYARLRRELSDAENRASRSKSRARKSLTEDSLSRLLPGDVVDVPAGRAPGLRRGAELGPQLPRTPPGGADPGQPAAPDRHPRRRGPDGAADPDPDSQVLQRRRCPSPAATWPPRVRNALRETGRRRRAAPRNDDFGGPRRAEPGEADRRPAPRALRPTPATAAANARTTPAGPSAGGNSARRRTGWSARSRAGPTPSPRPSTGSAASWPATATWRPPSTGARPSARTASGSAGSTAKRTC